MEQHELQRLLKNLELRGEQQRQFVADALVKEGPALRQDHCRPGENGRFVSSDIEDSLDRVLAGLVPQMTLADNTRGCRADKRYCALTEGTELIGTGNSCVFLLEFWDGGVAMGQMTTASLETAARALHSWVARAWRLAEMQETYLEFRPMPDAWGFENGTEVEERWKDYLQNSHEWPHMSPFLEAAAANPTLRGLFPFFSLHTLRFSLCTDFPYLCAPPSVRVYQPGRFQVKHGDMLRGIGDASKLSRLCCVTYLRIQGRLPDEERTERWLATSSAWAA